MKVILSVLCCFALFSLVSSVAFEGDTYNSRYCNGTAYAKFYFNSIGCVQYTYNEYYKIVEGSNYFNLTFCNDSTCAYCDRAETFPLNVCNSTNSFIQQYSNWTKLATLPDTFGSTADDAVVVYFGNDTNCTYPSSANEIDVYTGGCQPVYGADNTTSYTIFKCSADKSNLTYSVCVDSACNNCTVFDTLPANQCVNTTFGGGYAKFYCGARTLNEYGACNTTGIERCVPSDNTKYQTCDRGFWQPYQSCQTGLVCNPSAPFIYCVRPSEATTTGITL